MKKRILTVVLFLALLVVLLSMQVVKAESFSSPLTEKSPTFKFVNLTDGNFKLQFPNENETHYLNGTIRRSYFISATVMVNFAMSATTTASISTVYYGVPKDPEQDNSQELSASILVFLCFGNAALMLDKLNVHLPIEIRETPKRIAQYFLPRARS
jgi:hypothetical protein